MKGGRWVALVALLLAARVAPAAAQYAILDDNKVEYRTFDWRVLRGAHVDLYFYPVEERLAVTALTLAEQNFDTLALRFDHVPTSRIPLILYASHVHFEQTGILPFIPPEGLLGVTDFAKRRVTLPFRGSLSDFHHTLRHEMVHAFQLSIADEQYDRIPRQNTAEFPLWWTEGLAEYWSAGEDARDEMILRDMVLSGTLPHLRQLDYNVSGLVYPLGGRLHRWLGQTYGDWRIIRMYQEIWRYSNFEAAIEAVYGKSIDRLDQEFQLYMKRAYLPVVEAYAPVTVSGRRLAPRSVNGAAAADTGGTSDAFYFTGDDGYITVRRTRLDGSRNSQKVLVAGRTSALESVHPFDSRIDAGRPGYLLLSSRQGERDALLIWNLARREVAGRYSFPSLVSVASPAWSADYQSVVFSGLTEAGVSDLYRVSMPDGQLTRVTEDDYQDLDPAPSPDGRWIAYTSDRGSGGESGAMNLFLKDVASGAVHQLTSGPWVDETPRWDANGRLFFASDRDGVLNIFSVDTLGNGRRETSAWTGAFGPAPIPGRDALLVTSWEAGELSVYQVPVDTIAERDTFTLPAEVAAAGGWQWPRGNNIRADDRSTQPYRRRFQFDIAAGRAIFVPSVGGTQGISVLFSDILEDHTLFFNVSTYQGQGLGGVLDNLSVTALYFNQHHRLNWGLAAFRQKGSVFNGGLEQIYDEDAWGGAGFLRYPLSRYTRIEGGITIEHSDRTDFDIPVAEPTRKGWIATHYLNFTFDNALWSYSGPIDGNHFSLTGSIGNDFSHARFDNYTVALDARKYLRFGHNSAYAIRAFGYLSGGDRPNFVNIGGTLGMRGYPLFNYIEGTRAMMLNQEVRLPALRYIAFGTPFGQVTFPGIQLAPFIDVGKAFFPGGEQRGWIGSYGLSTRLSLGPFITFRLDWGRRFNASDHAIDGYHLGLGDQKPGFLKFFFGYNY
ncbi:MAG: hypothetical protein ABI765_05740 [Gemmatimonadota bacterium]